MNTSLITKSSLIVLFVIMGICFSSAQNAIRIDDSPPGHSAIRIEDAGDNGISVLDADLNGIWVFNAGFNGIRVSNAAFTGIRVDNAVGNSLRIRGIQSGLATTSDFTSYIENDGGDVAVNAVLGLKLHQPTVIDQYITFLGTNEVNDILGYIAPNLTGGLTFYTDGSDYGEYLEKEDKSEPFEPGEIVGVNGGLISHGTDNAKHVVVITDQAAIAGNAPNTPNHARTDHEIVSFMGQVRTKVKGPVNEGDWIVPSGDNDGVGVALATDQLTLDHQIAGQAWESSTDPGVKRINTAVGLDQSEVLKRIIKEQNKQISSQQDQIDELRAMVMEIKAGL